MPLTDEQAKALRERTIRWSPWSAQLPAEEFVVVAALGLAFPGSTWVDEYAKLGEPNPIYEQAELLGPPEVERTWPAKQVRRPGELPDDVREWARERGIRTKEPS